MTGAVVVRYGIMTIGDALHQMLVAPASTRAQTLEQWLSAQPDAQVAARELVSALAAMEHAPYRVEGSNGDTEFICFHEAESIRVPLAEAASKCTDPLIQSELWTHASTSAWVTLELADLPYGYAKRALCANPSSEAAWVAFKSALYSDNTDLFWDIEKWIEKARQGLLPAELPRRALAEALVVAKEVGWDESDMAALKRLGGAWGTC